MSPLDENREKPRTFQVIYPDGEIMEFEAALADLSYSESLDGGFDLSGPLQIKSTVRTGSIYDREGSD